MSTTYDLACPELKVKLWVGQRDYIYGGADHIKALGDFLHATKGHPLLFVSEHCCRDDIVECVYFSGSPAACALNCEDGITRMDAKTATDMLDNPGQPNQALVDLLKLK